MLTKRLLAENDDIAARPLLRSCYRNDRIFLLCLSKQFSPKSEFFFTMKNLLVQGAVMLAREQQPNLGLHRNSLNTRLLM